MDSISVNEVRGCISRSVDILLITIDGEGSDLGNRRDRREVYLRKQIEDLPKCGRLLEMISSINCTYYLAVSTI